MRYFHQKLTLILTLLSLFLGCSKIEYNPEISTPRVVLPPRIDGILSEEVWKNSSFIYLKDNKTRKSIYDSVSSASIATCYDDKNLYIAFICNDKDIFNRYNQRDEHLWKEECVEVFIDVDEDPNTYVEIEVSPNNILFDSFIVDTTNIDLIETPKFNLTGIKTAVKVDGTVNKRDDVDSRWAVEILIPFAELIDNYDKTYLDNIEMKINFYRIDRDENGPLQYAWSPTLGRFHKPSKFGRIRFLE